MHCIFTCITFEYQIYRTMNKQLKLEVEKYADDLFGFSNENHSYWEDCQRHFIAGATSKWVEKQKLEFAIEQLKKIKIAVSDKNPFTVYNIAHQIQELEQKLSEL